MLPFRATAPDLRDDDARAVHAAAALLRVPEFSFFRLAYQRWFGETPKDTEIEPHFMLYLYRRRVPPWVRHLARQVTARSREGAIDPREFGALPVLPPPPPRRARQIQAVVLATFYGGAFVLFTLAAL